MEEPRAATDSVPPGELEPTPVEEVERALDLEREDREDLPGLYRMNVVRMPLVRLLGFNLAVLVAPFHNLAVFGGVDPGAYALLVVGVEAYCLVAWLLLRLFFTRIRSIHLGTLFVWTDLAVMTWLVHFTGGPASLFWPIYFVRTADQMWIGRGRAMALALGGAAAYSALILALSFGEGPPVAWDVEAVKVLVLLGSALALAATAGQPWDVRDRARTARDWILRLEEQSRELDRERRKAEAANQAKSDFLARMSHELRTPLNSVIGFTNVLLKGPESPSGAREREFLKRIRQNGVHLLALINDVLDLARIEEGRMEVVPADVDLGDLVRSTVEQLEGRRMDLPLDIEVSVPEGLRPVRADEARLRQVLINLVGNAIKFTFEGRVEVSVESDPATSTPLRIRVRDTGIGIFPDRLPHIFEPFEQIEEGRDRRYPGTGLGLAISQRLCQLMGMEITVESEPGEGSVFTVELHPGAAGSGSGRPPAEGGAAWSPVSR